MDISQFLNFRDRWQLTKDIALWLICGFILLAVVNLPIILSFKLPFKLTDIYFPDSIKVTAFFLVLVLLFVLLKGFLKWVGIMRNKDKTYIFHSKDWPDKWIFNGKTELNEEGYLCVKSSRAGCLLKDCYWKDFKMSFEMRFLNESDKAIPAPEYQKLIGFIFRAEDLDNYFMIEVGNHDGRSGVKPHVRYKGGWEGMSIEKTDLNFSEFTKVTLKVKGDTAIISMNGPHTFTWVLPMYVDVNHWESGVREEMEKKKNVVVETFSGHVQKIPFRLGYGLVGFRAYMKHGAIIRNLRIEPLVS